MDAAIMAMIGVIIPMVGGTLGLVSKMNTTVQAMDKRLSGLESLLKESKG
jgi:hypothetical protein